MKFRRERKEEIDMSLTPLIDIVFLLLIFFMVSTTFEHTAELKVVLPTTEAAASAETTDIIVVIDEKGQYYLGQTLVGDNKAALQQALQQQMRDKAVPSLQIKADAKAPYQSVVWALDIAKILHIEQLSLITNNQTPVNAE